MKYLNKSICIRLCAAGYRHLSEKIVCSKVKNYEVPKLSVNDYVWKDLDKWHDKIAMVCADTRRSYSYLEIYKKSIKLANFLSNFKKLKKGDVIAIILPNVPEYPIVILGATQAGFKITPLNPSYTRDELIYHLGISKPKIIITLTELWPNVTNILNGSLFYDIPIVVMNHSKESMDTPLGAIKFKEILENTYVAKNSNYKSTDVICLLYSSGTTGFPKCIELTMKNIVSSIHHPIAPKFKIQNPTEGINQDVFPVIVPMFHIFGINTILTNMSLGCKAITVPKFCTNTFINILEKDKPDYCYLVPPLIQLLVREPRIRTEYLTRIRTIFVGAAPLGVNDVERFNKKTNGMVHIVQAYGLTETAGATHMQTPTLLGGVKQGGSGMIYPNMEFKIKNDLGETLDSNKTGVIFLRRPQVFKSYFNNPQVTKSTLSADGWVNTGDLGHYDDDGHLFITDRSKEMIKVNGFQVAPAELEDILRSHPDIEEAAVVGVPHDQFGEVPKAYIVPNSAKSVITFKKYTRVC